MIRFINTNAPIDSAYLSDFVSIPVFISDQFPQFESKVDPGFHQQHNWFIISEFKSSVEKEERHACDSCVQKLHCLSAASCSNSLSSSKMDEIKSIFAQPWFSFSFLIQRKSLLSLPVCCYNMGYLPSVMNVLFCWDTQAFIPSL